MQVSTKPQGTAEEKSLQFPLVIFEDNEAVIKIVIKKRSPALRHVLRTHRVHLDYLYDLLSADDISIKYVSAKLQVADIFTKAFVNSEVWNRLF